MTTIIEIYEAWATGDDYYYDNGGELFPRVVKIDPPTRKFIIDAWDSIIPSCE